MILVTGGSGLVGSHLLYELMSDGRKVRALMRSHSSTELVRQLFEWYNPEKGREMFSQIEWVKGEVNDIVSLQEALEGVDYVYHCAAIVSFLPAERQLMMRVNVEGTANLVNICVINGIKKFCHCSSVAAIGRPDSGNRVDETLVWKTSKTNLSYAISKYGSEREVWRAAEEGLHAVIVNPTIIIGPGNPSRSSAQLYQSVKKGLRFYTEGVTGFVDARDVARAMIVLMEGPISNERFILSSENLSYKKVFELFARHAGKRPPHIRATRLMSEIAWRMEKVRQVVFGGKPLLTKETARSGHSVREFSNQKFVKATGFQFRSVAEAIENTVGFFRGSTYG